MFEIIPNWHPFFVHFSIGLLLTAAVLHVLVLVVGNTTTQRSLTTVANWNLWVGIGFAVITVIAGWFAFNSVNHDTPSHLVMLEHRKWAVATTIVFVALGLWSFMRAKNSKPIALPLTAAVVVAAGLL
ncbi:MAG: DUF2231 domain-containing protein, partial [Gammaproteobacteria bacterium]|nr:DUF2231 domain-containing protein [Gammaproteobacteria bacterium]